MGGGCGISQVQEPAREGRWGNAAFNGRVAVGASAGKLLVDAGFGTRFDGGEDKVLVGGSLGVHCA